MFHQITSNNPTTTFSSTTTRPLQASLFGLCYLREVELKRNKLWVRDSRHALGCSHDQNFLQALPVAERSSQHAVGFFDKALNALNEATMWSKTWYVYVYGCINVCAQTGKIDQARLFELMKDLGIAHNRITFLGVLTACIHGGLVEERLRRVPYYPFQFSTMARSKIKHELISNESKRKATFKKRKSGLLKKMNELTTLCGVMGLAIIYSTFDNRPDIWSTPQGLIHVLDRFKKFPRKIRDKYTVNQKAFLGSSISKLSKWLENEDKKIQGLETELTLSEYLAGKSLQDLNCSEEIEELDRLLEEKIKLTTDKIKTMDQKSKKVTAKNGKKK